MRVWETATGREIALFRHPGPVRAVEFTPDGRYLIERSVVGVTIRDLTRAARYREFERLLPDARRMLQSTPDHAPSLKLLGEWYAFRGVWRWGAEFLEEARLAGADVSSLELARCLWKARDVERAKHEFRVAMDRNEAPREYIETCLAAVATTPPAPPTGPPPRDQAWAWAHASNPKAWAEDPTGSDWAKKQLAWMERQLGKGAPAAASTNAARPPTTSTTAPR